MKSTSISNPFDDIDSDEVATVQAKVSEAFERELFTNLFPNRGSRSNITANLLTIFHDACKKVGITSYSEQNEPKALAILQELKKCSAQLSL